MRTEFDQFPMFIYSVDNKLKGLILFYQAIYIIIENKNLL